jgi:ribonucleotide monophosphatase NagD (HAD superfamily)
VRGGTPIPGAGLVLEYLVDSQASPNVSRRLPFVFITNGGGCLEEAKATEICDVFFPGLPHPVRSSQVGE